MVFLTRLEKEERDLIVLFKAFVIKLKRNDWDTQNYKKKLHKIAHELAEREDENSKRVIIANVMEAIDNAGDTPDTKFIKRISDLILEFEVKVNPEVSKKSQRK